MAIFLKYYSVSAILFVLIICMVISSSQTHYITALSLSESDTSEIAKAFLRRAQTPEVSEWMVEIRRKLHEYPELLYKEFQTSELIQARLSDLGIRHDTGVACTGVVGYIGTGNKPYVALRADMDALPIQELVEWEYKSKVPGKMHACGHDAHVSMVLGAAKILKEYEKDLPGTILLVFQPAEEGGAGAQKVLETGLLDEVSAIFGLHVAPGAPVGMTGGRAGEVMAGSGRFEAVITGRGGHAAQPHEAIDPVVAAANVIHSLQHLISREADPADSQVVTVAKLEGSNAFNIIPDFVTIGGSFRAFKPIYHLKQRIEEVIVSQAAVSRCNATVNFFDDEHPLYPAVINDEDLHVHFKRVAGDMLGAERVLEVPLMTVSEDFAFYQQQLKGYFFFLGIQNATHGDVPVHSPHFQIAEDAFPYGAALHASLAATYLTDVLGFRATHRLRDEL